MADTPEVVELAKRTNLSNVEAATLGSKSNNSLVVNEKLTAKIKAINRSKSTISNGMITISIPQGFSVDEDSLIEQLKRFTLPSKPLSWNGVCLLLTLPPLFCR